MTDSPRPDHDFPEIEERMRSVVDHVIDGIITIDEQGIVLTFNPAAERTFGYAAAEVIGQNIKMLMPEPYRHEHDGYIDNYLRTGQAKIIGIGREVLGMRKDGSTFPMELAISEFRISQKRYFTGIVRDITGRKQAEEELRRAEERMRSVVNHVIDGIITIDADGIIDSFNPAAQKLFGYERSEVIGHDVKMLMPDPYHGQHDQYLRNYLRTGQAKIIGIGREVLGKRKNGSTFPMELAVSEFYMGSRRYFTGIVRDITERKRLENELQEQFHELAEADKQKNEFLAMLSHELRNPLAPMRNAVHLMKMPSADVAMVDHARDIIERQLHQLVRLVDDLLDVSRIIRGRIELRKSTVDLNAVVRRALETAQPVIDAQGHELSVTLPQQPVYVLGDLIRLAQVISNLLTNAAKYTGRSGRIALVLQRDGDTARLTITDSGVGIAPELLPRVFDLFVQGDHSLARTQGGLGIGLTLVKRLVEMHGGNVRADSAGEGKGSQFQVWLPALPDKSTGVSDEAARSAASSPLKHARVLVVDDNVDAAESVATILGMSGLDARCVFDGPAALKAAEQYLPDVVVVDIGLPGIDGYQVASHLRRRFRSDVTLIAMTGYGQEEDRRRSHEAGFNHHLTKPVDPTDLVRYISEAQVRPAA